MAAARLYSDAGQSIVDLSDDGNLFMNFNEKLAHLSPEQKEVGIRLRRHLQFFFMNPLDKYRIRQQFPFKLVLQILKVVFVTIQLILFAQLRISHVDFLDETVTVMRHKFLKDWTAERDTIAYPPSGGDYSVYTSNQIIEHFSHIVTAYYSIQNDSFAAFSYDTVTPQQTEHWQIPVVDDNNTKLNETEDMQKRIDFNNIPPINLCIHRIADVNIENSTYLFDISEVNECFVLNFTRTEVEQMKDQHAIREMLAKRNVTFKGEDALIISKAFMKFNLRTIHFSPLQNDQSPECYQIMIQVKFDNSRHTGQIKVDLNAVISYINICNGRVLQVTGIGIDTILIAIVDVFVLMMCVASLILCIRALVKAHLLQNTTCEFFERAFGQKVSIKDQWEFYNLWYGMIVLNDILIIIGTISKATIEFRDFDSDLFTMTGIVLGLGVLLVYIGLLRYFGFFNQYNILVLTLKKSLPSIIRFMVCAVILYCGFLIAGWVIIGPYSMKFRTLAQSSEALFSLLNGDDMFATFYTISDSNAAIKVFGTIYIYTFVSLFIYVVLSLFIAIIMDAYEIVKSRYNQGLAVEKSTLQEFLASEELPSANSQEAREIFATDQLLRIDHGWPLLPNPADLLSSVRHRLSPSRFARSSAGNGGPFFDYRSFENTTHGHDGASVAEDQQQIGTDQLGIEDGGAVNGRAASRLSDSLRMNQFNTSSS